MKIGASRKAILLGRGPLVLVASAMVWFLGTDTEGQLTWWGYGFLTLAMLLALQVVVDLMWPPTLLIGPNAFGMRSWRSTTTIPWADIGAFRVIPAKDQLSRRVPHFLPWNIAVARASARQKIGLDYRKGVSLTPVREQARATAQTQSLCDWAAPDCWTLPAQELVDLLNAQLELKKAG